LSDAASNQHIFAYLIQPIQRIPRYRYRKSIPGILYLNFFPPPTRLLLEDMIKHTASDHKDKEGLQQAHKLICEVATVVNSKTEEAEQTAKVMNVQHRLVGDVVNINICQPISITNYPFYKEFAFT